MGSINIARDDEYYTQRNNPVSRASTCQVTAEINILTASRIPFACPDGMQPEEYLRRLTEEPDVKEKLSREFPRMAHLPPREVHDILAWVVNEKLCKRKVTMFSMRVDLREILCRLVRYRCGSLVTGKFTPEGHVVGVIGFETITPQKVLEAAENPGAINLSSVTGIRIRDSWGDWNTGYTDTNGANVLIAYQDFIDLARVSGSTVKWAHLFDRDGKF